MIGLPEPQRNFDPDADRLPHLSPQGGDTDAGDAPAGDSEGPAEAEIAGLYETPIRIMAVRRTGRPDAADDIVQETLASVIGAWREGQLRDPDRFSAFVYGTAQNVIRNFLRRQGRRSALRPDPDSWWDSSASDPRPLDRLIREDLRRQVRNCLEELRPNQREVRDRRGARDLPQGRAAAEVARPEAVREALPDRPG